MTAAPPSRLTTPAPVIVVSSPRSGSSWTARMLRTHPGLQVYTHNLNQSYRLYGLTPMRSVSPWGVDGLLAGQPIGIGERRRRQAFLNWCFPPSDGTLVPVWSSPTTAGFLRLFAETLPNARFVHLRRDPVAVVASMQRFARRNDETGTAQRWRDRRHRGRKAAVAPVLSHWFHRVRWSRTPISGYLGVRPAGMIEAARSNEELEFLCWYRQQVENEIEAGLEPVPADRRTTITYESLVENTREALTDLLTFMGAEADSAFLDAAVAGVRAGQASTSLSEADRRRIETASAEFADVNRRP